MIDIETRTLRRACTVLGALGAKGKTYVSVTADGVVTLSMSTGDLDAALTLPGDALTLPGDATCTVPGGPAAGAYQLRDLKEACKGQTRCRLSPPTMAAGPVPEPIGAHKTVVLGPDWHAAVKTVFPFASHNGSPLDRIAYLSDGSDGRLMATDSYRMCAVGVSGGPGDSFTIDAKMLREVTRHGEVTLALASDRAQATVDTPAGRLQVTTYAYVVEQWPFVDMLEADGETIGTVDVEAFGAALLTTKHAGDFFDVVFDVVILSSASGVEVPFEMTLNAKYAEEALKAIGKGEMEVDVLYGRRKLLDEARLQPVRFRSTSTTVLTMPVRPEEAYG